MSAHQAEFPIVTMARVLGVSKAGYYAWLRRPPSARAVADRVLMKRIRTIHVTSHETYGVPRVHAELRAGGQKHGRKRIARLMRAAGIVGVSRRRGTVVTTRRDKAARPAPDLVDRDFSASAPNRLWVADITFIPTAAGFLYLAVVLDAFSRRIVGWAMANHLRTELVLDALGGDWPAGADGRDPSQRPGKPVHLARVRRPLPGSGRASVNGIGRRRVRQRHVRKLLRDARVRAAGATPVRLAGRGPNGRLPLYRGLVQPGPAALRPRLSLADCL